MAIWYAKSAGDVAAANAWNSAANGSGTDATLTAGSVGSAADTCDLNGLAMTSTTGLVWTQALIQATTGTLTPAGTLTINGGVTYNGTATTGMVIVGTGAALTINGQLSTSAAGYAIVQSGTGTTTINNGTSVAILQSSTGRTINVAGSGAVSITGNISTTGTGVGMFFASTSTASTFAGNILCSGMGTGISWGSGTIAWTPGSGTSIAISGTGQQGWSIGGGIVNVSTDIVTSDTSNLIRAPINVGGGTLNWTGSVAHPASSNCYIAMTAGVLNLVKQAAPYTPLILANSGTVVINKLAGTLNTADAGAGAAQINNQTSTSYAAILGGTDANKGIIAPYSTGVIVIED